MAVPFTVAWKNPVDPIPSPGTDLVKCGVCGKQIHPLDAIGLYELVINSGEYEGYEHPFYVCSEKCDRNRHEAIEKKIKELS